jgi:hypothetical protein
MIEYTEKTTGPNTGAYTRLSLLTLSDYAGLSVHTPSTGRVAQP